MNLLANISNSELISRTKNLVRTERKITHLVLQHIAEIEYRKLYADLGYDGMYSYLTRGLGYSDGSAYRRLQSARLLVRVPELAEKLQDGKINLSQLTQVQRSIKAQSYISKIVAEVGTNADFRAGTGTGNGIGTNNEPAIDLIAKQKLLDVFNKLENVNSFETQKVLASELNLVPAAQEKLRPQKDESVRFEITFSQEQFTQLQQAKALLSHICPHGSWSEVITTLAKKIQSKEVRKISRIKISNQYSNGTERSAKTQIKK